MNRQEQFEQLKKEYEQTEVPDVALEAIQKGIRQAKEEKQNEKTKTRRKRKKRTFPMASSHSSVNFPEKRYNDSYISSKTLLPNPAESGIIPLYDSRKCERGGDASLSC